MLQRIGLAQAILHDPEIVFLDEPMSGLDPVGRKMVKDLMLELKKQGKTLFFNTHILSDVEAICDRCAIISKGEIIADVRVSEITVSIEDFFMDAITRHQGEDF
jgi:ABC-2 type transport system ATP-binding protein